MCVCLAVVQQTFEPKQQNFELSGSIQTQAKHVHCSEHTSVNVYLLQSRKVLYAISHMVVFVWCRSPLHLNIKL